GTLVSRCRQVPGLVATFRESPEAARRLCLLLGMSRIFHRSLEQHPDTLGALADDGALRPRGREALLASAEAAIRWRDEAEARRRLVKGPSPATAIYPHDLELRPEGRQGTLVRSLDGYRAYYERWAQTWERQALLRARPVAGDPELGRRFMEMVGGLVWRPT